MASHSVTADNFTLQLQFSSKTQLNSALKSSSNKFQISIPTTRFHLSIKAMGSSSSSSQKSESTTQVLLILCSGNTGTPRPLGSTAAYVVTLHYSSHPPSLIVEPVGHHTTS